MESYSVTKKEVNPTIRDNMDKSRVYYTKWNNTDKVKYVWYQLYVESKTKQKWFHRNRHAGCPGMRGDKNGRHRSKGINFQI